jgi:probable phosphoglycerate mutase
VLRLYLLRHGETQFSLEDRFCGRIDAPLTDVGRKMAACFAEAYDDVRWAAIHSSLRARALATAAPLAARTGLFINPEPDLDEIDHGIWQGQTKQEVAVADPLRFQRWCADPTGGAPGGESLLDVQARALRFLDDITARHGDGNVLAVSHKTTLRVLIATVMGADLARHRERIAQPICGVTMIELSPEGPDLQMLADLGHLPLALRARALGPLTAGAAQAPRAEEPEAVSLPPRAG